MTHKVILKRSHDIDFVCLCDWLVELHVPKQSVSLAAAVLFLCCILPEMYYLMAHAICQLMVVPPLSTNTNSV